MNKKANNNVIVSIVPDPDLIAPESVTLEKQGTEGSYKGTVDITTYTIEDSGMLAPSVNFTCEGAKATVELEIKSDDLSYKIEPSTLSVINDKAILTFNSTNDAIFQDSIITVDVSYSDNIEVTKNDTNKNVELLFKKAVTEDTTVLIIHKIVNMEHNVNYVNKFKGNIQLTQPIEITFKFDKDTYIGGETVYVNFEVSSNVEKEQIKLKTTTSNLITIDGIKATTKENYLYEFKLISKQETNTLKLVATYNDITFNQDLIFTDAPAELTPKFSQDTYYASEMVINATNAKTIISIDSETMSKLDGSLHQNISDKTKWEGVNCRSIQEIMTVTATETFPRQSGNITKDFTCTCIHGGTVKFDKTTYNNGDPIVIQTEHETDNTVEIADIYLAYVTGQPVRDATNPKNFNTVAKSGEKDGYIGVVEKVLGIVNSNSQTAGATINKKSTKRK